VAVKRVRIDPVMELDELDDEVLRDDADEIAAAVEDGEA